MCAHFFSFFFYCFVIIDTIKIGRMNVSTNSKQIFYKIVAMYLPNASIPPNVLKKFVEIVMIVIIIIIIIKTQCELTI